MKINQLLFVFLISSVALVGCEKNEIDPIRLIDKNSASRTTASPEIVCGQIKEVKLLAGQHIEMGSVSVSNDEENLYVTYTSTGSWRLKAIQLYVGACGSIPVNKSGSPMIGHFPNKSLHDLATTFTYDFPKSTIDGCGCIAAHAEVVRIDHNGQIVQEETAWAAGTRFVPKGTWATYFEYCIQGCNHSVPCQIKPGDFTTYTEQAYGSAPEGTNTGTFVHNNFASAFANGLAIGNCGNIITFSSASGITDFLPRNKGREGINIAFAGQVTALSLSVGFDLAFEGFGASSTNLNSLYVASGTFAGWTVGEVLAEANKAIGGCSQYSITELYDVVSSINENFAEGTTDNGFLTCERTISEG